MSFVNVKLNLTKKQILQIGKNKPTQIKKDQLVNNGAYTVALDKMNLRRYKRAKMQNTGFRIHLTDEMITGSGFWDVLKSMKNSAVKGIKEYVIPYAKGKFKEVILPAVKSEVLSGINKVQSLVSDKLEQKLSSVLGPEVGKQLAQYGTAKLSGFAKDKLDKVEGDLMGMGFKKGVHFKITKGGKISWSSIGNFLKPLVRPVSGVALTGLASALGQPALGMAASGVVDGILESQGLGVLVQRSNADKMALVRSHRKKPAAKKPTKGKKQLGKALFPMGSRGGALFPM